MDSNRIVATETASPDEGAARIHPTAISERVELLDVIRGFAVFGILLVNMGMFKVWLLAPVVHDFVFDGAMDRAVRYAILFVGQGKFYSIFSMLFGLGLAIQMQRAEARGVRIVPLYARRLTVLLLIGMVHGFLIWYGDILATYALLGYLLIPFRNRKPKTLLIWTIVLLVVPALFQGGLTVVGIIASTFPEIDEVIREMTARSTTQLLEGSAEAARVYSSGTWSEIMGQRTSDVLTIYQFLFMVGPTILALFLIGLNLGRHETYRHVDRFVPFLRRAVPWFLVIGVAGSAAMVYGMAVGEPMAPTPLALVAILGGFVGTPAMAFLYVSVIVLLFRRDAWHRRLAHLAPIGRMALTNYLSHSIICTLLFYSYGLGWFGKVRPIVGLAFTLVIFGLQIPFSAWWLRRYRFGPVEWLWRSATYRELQPMRRN